VVVVLLDDRTQRLLGHAAEGEEGHEFAALAQLWDPQDHLASEGLSVTVTITIALIASELAALALPGPPEFAGFALHPAFGSKAGHLAQEIRLESLTNTA